MPAVLEHTEARQQQSAAGGWSRPRFLVGLAAFVALALFAVVNIALFVAMGEEKTTTDMWGGTGSIDLAVDGYAHINQPPTVVLLGSSLVMYPFWAMDREKHPNIGDIFHHHQSLELAQALQGAGVKPASVYSFAIFGQMVSDAFIYVNEYLKAPKTPRYLVYGLAPRDFSDFDLPAPMATLTFKRLVGLPNLGRYAMLYLPGLQDKADFVASHICFFYGRRWHLQHEVLRGVEKAYAWLGITQPAKTSATTQDNAGFMMAGREDVRWTNSLNEYKRRYRNIDQKDLGIQMGFLKRLLETCHERNIKVVLVNMPLTDLNRGLFPPGFYKRFCGQLADIARIPGVTFVDLGASPDFSHADFWDTTHLNHAGGRKLLKHIVPVLTK